jgi:hypothetical protein
MFSSWTLNPERCLHNCQYATLFSFETEVYVGNLLFMFYSYLRSVYINIESNITDIRE